MIAITRHRDLVLALLCLFVLAGCTSYYEVTDPTSGKVYYSTEVQQRGGATMLKDGKTGSRVTIQNSEVKQINQEEYESGKVR
jgi:uncharacterized protein YceK